MKRLLLKHFIVLIFMSLGFIVFAQKSNKLSAPKYPTSFTISFDEIDQLFSNKTNATVHLKSNTYLDNSKVLLNSSYKDNKQLKLKLSYFKNAELFIQINGKDSKIIYMLSDDNSVFYNSVADQTKITLTQCKKDDIFSE